MPSKILKLNASAFRAAATTIGAGPSHYSCHALSVALNREPNRDGYRDRWSPEHGFYNGALGLPLGRPRDDTPQSTGYIPPCFGWGGYPDGIELNDEQLCTTRIIALTLAAILIDEGWYFNKRGVFTKRRKSRRKS